MLGRAEPPPVDVLLAHPVTEPFRLPVSPLLGGAIAAAVVLVTAYAAPAARRMRAATATRPVDSWAGPLSVPERVTRTLAVLLLLLAVVAGRVGADDELENLAPALLVGVAWPLLVLGSVLGLPLWRWMDPWDAVARVLRSGPGPEPSPHVWPAVIVTFSWVWFLSAYPQPLAPRAVSAFLALYTLGAVAGCLAVGRRRWLTSWEPLGLLLSWMTRLARGRLVAAELPSGAEAMLGVLAGGVLFGVVRQSEVWGGLNTSPNAGLLALLGVAGASALAGAFLWAAGELMRGRGAAGAVARCAIPAVASIVVAVAMGRHRLTTSLQLLPGLLGDPFGAGWDLLGPAGADLNPSPLGTTELLLAQLWVLLVGHLIGGTILARDSPRGSRTPGAVVLSGLAGVSVCALVAH